MWMRLAPTSGCSVVASLALVSCYWPAHPHWTWCSSWWTTMALNSKQDSGPYATMSCAGATHPSHPVSATKVNVTGPTFLLYCRPDFLTLRFFLDLRRVVNMTALFYWYPVYVLFPILGWFLSHMNKSCYYSLGRILLTFIRYYLGTGLDTGDPHDWYLSGLFIWTAPLSRWKLLIDIHRQALLYQSS